jgi:hypothetical protein
MSTAFRAFFAALGNARSCERIDAALRGEGLPKDNRAPAPTTSAPLPPPTPAAPVRSDAITLLAALQREARLLDLVQEPLDAYTDEQIGGAARKVLHDTRQVLNRCFSLGPVLAGEEGAAVEVPAGNDPARVHLTGTVPATGPYRGRLTHPGWVAQQCQLPRWTGSKEAALVVAPAEVEVS